MADVVFGRDVQFLGFHPGVLPLFGGGFLEMEGLFRGGRLELAGPLGGGVAELLGGLDGAVLQRGGFFLGGVDEFAGFFASGGAEIVRGLRNRRCLGEACFRIKSVSGGKWIVHGGWFRISDETS